MPVEWEEDEWEELEDWEEEMEEWEEDEWEEEEEGWGEEVYGEECEEERVHYGWDSSSIPYTPMRLDEIQEMVFMRQEDFLALVGDVLMYENPERVYELRGGYYNGSRMRLWELGGVEVCVDGRGDIYMTRDAYQKLLREVKLKREEIEEEEE